MSQQQPTKPFAQTAAAGTPTEEQLLAWLAGTLSPEDARRLELQMADDEAIGDALEGLQNMGADETVKRSSRLNNKLDHLLKEKKNYRRGIGELHWIWMTVIIVLLLAMAAFCVLYFMNKH